MRASVVALFASIPGIYAVSPLVDLGYASYAGIDNGNGISQWLGLRYAAPPIASLRFKPPSDPAHMKTIQQADKVRSLENSQLILCY